MRWRQGDQRARERDGQHASEDTTCKRQDGALREELTQDAAATGSQCAAHGDLLRAPGRTDQQQVRSIHAGDEPQQGSSGAQDEQRGARVAHDEQRERSRHGTQVAPPARSLAAKGGAQLRSCLCGRGAWRQPAYGDSFACVERGERYPDVRARRELEAGRRDTDDGVRRVAVVQYQPPAEYARRAREQAAPDAVADHGNRRGSLHIVVGSQRASKQRTRAEHMEEVPGHDAQVQQERAVPLACRLRPRIRADGAGHLLQCPGFPAEALEVRRGERQVAHAALCGTPEHNHAILLVQRERPP